MHMYDTPATAVRTWVGRWVVWVVVVVVVVVEGEPSDQSRGTGAGGRGEEASLRRTDAQVVAHLEGG